MISYAGRWNIGRTALVAVALPLLTLATLPTPAEWFGVGLGGVFADMNIWINGVAHGLLGPRGMVTNNVGRNGYLRIQRQAGDAPITKVRFLATQGNDFVRWDHLAYDLGAVPTEESTWGRVKSLFL